MCVCVRRNVEIVRVEIVRVEIVRAEIVRVETICRRRRRRGDGRHFSFRQSIDQ